MFRDKHKFLPILREKTSITQLKLSSSKLKDDIERVTRKISP